MGECCFRLGAVGDILAALQLKCVLAELGNDRLCFDLVADVDVQGLDLQSLDLGLDLDLFFGAQRAGGDDAIDQVTGLGRGDDDGRKILGWRGRLFLPDGNGRRKRQDCSHQHGSRARVSRHWTLPKDDNCSSVGYTSGKPDRLTASVLPDDNTHLHIYGI